MQRYLYELAGIKTRPPYMDDWVPLFIGTQKDFENFRKTSPQWKKVLQTLQSKAKQNLYDFVFLYRRRVLENGEIRGLELLEEKVS